MLLGDEFYPGAKIGNAVQHVERSVVPPHACKSGIMGRVSNLFGSPMHDMQIAVPSPANVLH
ncbi:MAG TPA: hypothetical protein VGN57_16135 [Pirellulaceae bacterium]|jgi:hypothetical protein|nr:hypothetical protein [Pirellulaceae bacterium]